jgi:hypothetical protein
VRNTTFSQLHFMTPPGKPTAPKAPRDEKLPWEKLYEACLARIVPPKSEWDADEKWEISEIKRIYGEKLRTPPEGITLELLASTAVALLPVEGVNAKNVVGHAFDLLFECGELLEGQARAQRQLEALKTRQKDRRELDAKSLRIKLSAAAHRVTGYKNATDALHNFKMFIEVFYGEVLADKTLQLLELRNPPLKYPSFDAEGNVKVEEGNYKTWVKDTYERYLERGLREDEVAYLAKKYKELKENGFLEKSTPRPLSRTKKKKQKQKASVLKHS